MLKPKKEFIMNNEELKKLVKKHFNLVEPTVEETVEETKVEMSEVAAEQSFGEILTADGELTLTYEGEELSVGLPIFVKTDDGNVAAPDGEHALEGGVIIKTEGGSIVEVSEKEIEAAEEEEIVIGEVNMTEDAKETESSETKENFEEEEEVMEEEEEIIKAMADIIIPMIEEMKEEIEEMKKNFSKTETKVKEFALAPAVERTKAEIKSRNQSKVKNDFNPINEDKRKQFERLLKKQNKKQ
jgi:Mg2+ and Co2+ transporter CorA